MKKRYFLRASQLDKVLKYGVYCSLDNTSQKSPYFCFTGDPFEVEELW